MNIDIPSILKLLEQNKYLVTVTQTDNGCELFIPGAKLLKRPNETVTIDVIKQEDESYIITAKFKKDEEQYIAQENEVAMYIELMIVQIVEDYAKYSSLLVKYLDKNGHNVSSQEFFQTLL